MAKRWVEIGYRENGALDGENAGECEQHWVADVEGTLKAVHLIEETGCISTRVLAADYRESAQGVDVDAG
jgi:hypothetical protein